MANFWRIKIAETNSFFGNVVNTLNIEKDESIFCNTGDETNPLLLAIKNQTNIAKYVKDKALFQKSDWILLTVDEDITTMAYICH